MSDLIDRQQAIEAICMETCGVSLKNVRCRVHCTEVQAVEKLPPIQPASCEDAVSRKAVAGIYTALWETIGTIMDRDEWDDGCKATANELPPAQPEPKRGKWIYKTDLITVPTGYWECSECKEGRLLYEANFCPNCGADMRER